MPTSPKTAGTKTTGPAQRWAPPFSLGQGQDLPFDEAIARIEDARRLGIDPSLDPIRALLEELGHPERAYRCVQVAGTNGKTSTSRYTAALLRGAGHRVGLYTSPHLVSYTERVEVDGAVMGEEPFASGVSWALAAWDRVRARGDAAARLGVTEFELLTAAALVMYAQAGVDVAVLEVGLGGRWDATSAVDTCACAITGIGLDHTGILGDTLEAIAREKAAVIRHGVPCVLGTNAVRPQEVLDVMLDRCGDQGVVPTGLVDADTPAEDLPSRLGVIPRAAFAITKRPSHLADELRLTCLVQAFLPGESSGKAGAGAGVAGADDKTGGGLRKAVPDATIVECLYTQICLNAPAYQAQNVACALVLATLVHGKPLDLGPARAAIAACPTPGRFDLVGTDPLVVLDACHNPQSAAAFAQAVRDAEPDRSKRPTLLLGALADKDHRGIVHEVAPLFDRIMVTQSGSERACPAEDLAAEVAEETGVDPVVCPNVQEALDLMDGQPFVCCGTITLIGEVRGLLA